MRKDHADGYGGVLLAVSCEFTDNQITTDTDKELIATMVSTGCKTSLVTISVYRPPNTDRILVKLPGKFSILEAPEHSVHGS